MAINIRRMIRVKLKIVDECQLRNNWPKWKEEIQSLNH